MTLLDLTCGKLKSQIVSDVDLAPAAAARDAGDVRLRAMVEKDIPPIDLPVLRRCWNRRSSCNEPLIIADSRFTWICCPRRRTCSMSGFALKDPSSPRGGGARRAHQDTRRSVFAPLGAYLVSEIAGQAAVDVILGPAE